MSGVPLHAAEPLAGVPHAAPEGLVVHKFGGTSLADAAAIKTVIHLVRERLQQDPLLVVSAHAGVISSWRPTVISVVAVISPSRSIRSQSFKLPVTVNSVGPLIVL